ncbi:MAG: zinc ribbon domain-containing protein [Clostridia bacterium]|nr:zinc ribbon domain-containing protein [Clostridia bacterium]
MYCKYCGTQVPDGAKFCPSCGKALNDAPVCENRPMPAPDDAGGFGWGFLGFIIPILGLVLFLIWKDEYPLRAKSCGKGALISVIVSIVIVVLYFFFIFGLLFLSFA